MESAFFVKVAMYGYLEPHARSAGFFCGKIVILVNKIDVLQNVLSFDQPIIANKSPRDFFDNNKLSMQTAFDFAIITKHLRRRSLTRRDFDAIIHSRCSTDAGLLI